MNVWEIIIAIAGSAAIASLIQFFVNRHDKKKDLKEGIQSKLAQLEKDGLRTQLLLLILLRPDERQEIMTIGEYYFGKLHGNWYMSSVFNRWCDEMGENPDWFDKDR